MAYTHYTVDNYQMDDSIGYLTSQVKAVLGGSLNSQLADLGISYPQWKVLMHVHNERGFTAAELCRCLETDTGSMTRMIDRLEEKGFLRRVRSETDRRVVKLELTDAGRALVPAMLNAVVNVLNHHLRDFTPDEVALLKSLLRRVVAGGSMG
jgi:DNA-binding MarR family transcriptional regulator